MLKSTDFRLTYVAQKRVCFKLHFVIREFNTAQDENSLSLSTFKYKGILKFCFLSAKITLVCRVDNQFPWYKWSGAPNGKFWEKDLKTTTKRE